MKTKIVYCKATNRRGNFEHASFDFLAAEGVSVPARPVRSLEAPEIGWLLAQLEQRPAKLIKPPPRSMVWLACWDCKTPNAVDRASTVNYAPSAAPLPAPDGGEVAGQFTTLAVGFAAFQVFTV